jgi:hypothetical protein
MARCPPRIGELTQINANCRPPAQLACEARAFGSRARLPAYQAMFTLRTLLTRMITLGVLLASLVAVSATPVQAQCAHRPSGSFVHSAHSVSALHGHANSPADVSDCADTGACCAGCATAGPVLMPSALPAAADVSGSGLGYYMEPAPGVDGFDALPALPPPRRGI